MVVVGIGESMNFGHEQLDVSESENGKGMLIRSVSMLTKLGRREYGVKEDLPHYGAYDHDNDNEFQPSHATDG